MGRTGRIKKKAKMSAREVGARASTVFHLTLAQAVLDMALRMLAEQQQTSATIATAGAKGRPGVDGAVGLTNLMESDGAARETLLAHLHGSDCVRLAASCRSARVAVLGSRAAELRVIHCLAEERTLGEHAWAFDAFYMTPRRDSNARHLRRVPESRPQRLAWT